MNIKSKYERILFAERGGYYKAYAEGKIGLKRSLYEKDEKDENKT